MLDQTFLIIATIGVRYNMQYFNGLTDATFKTDSIGSCFKVSKVR